MFPGLRNSRGIKLLENVYSPSAPTLKTSPFTLNIFPMKPIGISKTFSTFPSFSADLFYWIISSIIPRMAANYSLDSHESSFEDAVFSNRLIGVFGASRMKATKALRIEI